MSTNSTTAPVNSGGSIVTHAHETASSDNAAPPEDNTPVPFDVVAPIVELALETASTDDARHIAQYGPDFVNEAWPVAMREVVVYVARAAGRDFEPFVTWLDERPHLRAHIHHLTLSERQLDTEPRVTPTNPVTCEAVIDVCERAREATKLTLRGLRILPPTALAPPHFAIAHPLHTMKITRGLAPDAFNAVVGIAARYPGLRELSVDGRGYLPIADATRCARLAESRPLALTLFTVYRCGIDKVSVVNAILQATAGTLQIFGVELLSVTAAHRISYGDAHLQLDNLHALRVLRVRIPVCVDGGPHTIAAHADLLLGMLRVVSPAIRTISIMMLDCTPCERSFTTDLAGFPIRALRYRLEVIPFLNTATITIGSPTHTPVHRAQLWHDVCRKSPEWRHTRRLYTTIITLQ